MQERTLARLQPTSLLDEAARATAVPGRRHDELAQLASAIGNSPRMMAQRAQLLRNRTGLPAQLQAHAYAQGAEIHLASGQERHLPHKAWHVVQPAQGRVRPTMQMRALAINDNAGLESETDRMGSRAAAGVRQLAKTTYGNGIAPRISSVLRPRAAQGPILQMKTSIKYHHGDAEYNKAKGPVGIKMVAHLDPNYPIKGTATKPDEDGASTALYGAVAAKNKGNYARGHLLNHDLGGFGVNENLYPITTGANARHSIMVEQQVKADLQSANKKNLKDPGSKLGVHYAVQVLGKPEHAQFSCQWNLEGLNDYVVVGEVKKRVIASKLGTPDPYQSSGHPTGLGDWHHGKRKGREDFDDYLKLQDITLHPSTEAGTHLADSEVSVLSPEEKAAAAEWAKKNPTEVSEEDKEYWAEQAEDENQQKADAALREETEGRVSRSKSARMKNKPRVNARARFKSRKFEKTDSNKMVKLERKGSIRRKPKKKDEEAMEE